MERRLVGLGGGERGLIACLLAVLCGVDHKPDGGSASLPLLSISVRILLLMVCVGDEGRFIL